MRNKKMTIADRVMKQIKDKKIKMKPRWYFFLGSFTLFLAITSLVIVSIFLISLITFFLRNHGGPMAVIRYQEIISNFPWWAVGVAVFGLFSGIILLKKYDFSYKKNFNLIVIGFILAIVFAGILIDILGFDNLWIKRGPMRKYYYRYQMQLTPYQYRNQK